jgi:hypothetical protein
MDNSAPMKASARANGASQDALWDSALLAQHLDRFRQLKESGETVIGRCRAIGRGSRCSADSPLFHAANRRAIAEAAAVAVVSAELGRRETVKAHRAARRACGLEDPAAQDRLPIAPEDLVE